MSKLQANITFDIETKKHLPPSMRRKTCSAGVKQYAMKCIEEMLRNCCDFPLKVKVKVTDERTGEGIVKEVQL